MAESALKIQEDLENNLENLGNEEDSFDSINSMNRSEAKNRFFLLKSMIPKEGVKIDGKMQQAIDFVQSGKKAVFVHGEAGTGKSTWLAHLVTEGILDPERTAIAAPTGIAANNIGGVTLHKLFGFGHADLERKAREENPKYETREVLRNLRTIVIDEVSMVRPDMMNAIDLRLRKCGPERNQPFGGVQMILMGDLNQLPPIVQDKERKEFRERGIKTNFFLSAPALQKVVKTTGLAFVELDQVHRQTEGSKFRQVLGNLRKGDISEEDLAYLNESHDPDSPVRMEDLDPRTSPLYITTTRANVDTANLTTLRKLEGEETHTPAESSGTYEIKNEKDLPTRKNLVYKEGAKIMMVNNDPDGRWCNGSMAVITKLPENGGPILVRLKDGGDEVPVFQHTWEDERNVVSNGKMRKQVLGRFTQYPFQLGYAITIHKCQGLTLDEAIVNLGEGTWEGGMLYTALSRLKTREGLTLVRPIREQDLSTSLEIGKAIDFLKHRQREEDVRNGRTLDPEEQKEHEAYQARRAREREQEKIIADQQKAFKDRKNIQNLARLQAFHEEENLSEGTSNPDLPLLQDLMGRGPAVRALLESLQRRQEFAEISGRDPGQAEVRVRLLEANPGQDPESLKVSLHLHPSQLGDTFLRSLNNGLQKAGQEPVSGNLEDRSNGTEQTLFQIPLEIQYPESENCGTTNHALPAIFLKACTLEQKVQEILDHGETPRPGRTPSDPVHLGEVPGLQAAFQKALKSREDKISGQEQEQGQARA